MALADRQRWILKSVVDTYVSSAEPVGSTAVALQAPLPISSATVRNEMAALEAQGFLVQPHTSAGRVPTDKAYREYVDHLMEPEVLPESEKNEIRAAFTEQIYDAAQLLKTATSLLSERTGYTSLTLSPNSPTNRIKQLKMLAIEPGRILIVLVMSAGVVRDRVVRASDLLTPQQLQIIAAALESGLREIPVQDITMVTVEDALDSVEIPDAVLNALIYEAYVSIKQAENLDVYREGVQKLVLQPEFQTPGEVHKVINTLSSDGLITGYLSRSEREDPFMIRIGQEIELDGMDACSLISTTYRLGDDLYGRIGVVGPKRMAYDRVIPRVNFIRESVHEFFGRHRRRE